MSEPSITVTLEPLKALGLVSYLRLAPSSQGGAETGYVNLGALIFNGTPYIIGSDDGVWQSAGANGWQHLNVVEAT